MSVWYSVSLLVAGLCLTASAPTPEDCEQLVKPLPLDNLAMIYGRWNFIEGFTDHHMFDSILKTVDSSWIHISPSSSSDKILTMAQENSLNGKCNSSTVSLTIVNNTMDMTYEDGGSRMHSLATCPDCLVFSFNSTVPGVDTPIHSLYIFGRNGTLKESDLEVFRKQAECLQFSQPANFHYNPDKGFCHEDKVKA